MSTFKSILCLLACMLGMGLVSALFADGEIWICIVMAFVMGAPLGFMVVNSIDAGKSKEYGRFCGGTLTLNERHFTLSSAVRVEAIPVQTAKYNEPELVYTGATVGGVSMGGVHVEGGDYTVKTIGYNGYRLGYRTERFDNKDHRIYDPISEIKLTTPTLVEEAKKNTSVKKYLKTKNGDTRIVLPNPEPIFGKDFKDPLSSEDAHAICNWITNSKSS